ncbi:T9SS type A sorting domain-containing protein [Saprospiraceae bacterium]|nr:T9SS type A sorting domain-containing protein [Saprospiraceae bacterium]
MKRIFTTVLAIAFSTALFAQVTGYSVGDVVEDFTVTDVNGNEHSLYDITASGQYVYLDFFFDTCPPCQSTTPIFNEFHDKYGCNEGDIFMMSMNNGSDNDNEVIAFEENFGGDYSHAPAVSNDGGADAVDSRFAITAYPTYSMIGPDNKLISGDIWPLSSVATFEATFPAGFEPQVLECTAVAVNDNITIDFQVFPNPNNGSAINIRLDDNTTQANIKIYNVVGVLVYTQEITASEYTINTELTKGSYIINIKTDAGVGNQKLVIE